MIKDNTGIKYIHRCNDNDLGIANTLNIIKYTRLWKQRAILLTRVNFNSNMNK